MIHACNSDVQHSTAPPSPLHLQFYSTPLTQSSHQLFYPLLPVRTIIIQDILTRYSESASSCYSLVSHPTSNHFFFFFILSNCIVTCLSFVCFLVRLSAEVIIAYGEVRRNNGCVRCKHLFRVNSSISSIKITEKMEMKPR